MLSEPDMQARYVAATLGVIETELRQLNISAGNRRALLALIASATSAATRLANELAPSTPLVVREANAPHSGGNVLPFRRGRKSH